MILVGLVNMNHAHAYTQLSQPVTSPEEEERIDQSMRKKRHMNKKEIVRWRWEKELEKQLKLRLFSLFKEEFKLKIVSENCVWNCDWKLCLKMSSEINKIFLLLK